MITAINRTFCFINQHPLAKRYLLNAYTKFLWWRIRSRTSKKWIEVAFLEHRKLFAKKGLSNNEDTTNHMVSSLNAHVSVKNMVSLNSLYTKHQPKLIKIDVEGYETEVINGASQLLKDDNLKAIIIELNGSGERYGYNEKDLHKHLTDHVFLPYRYLPFKRELVPLNTFGGFNTIYIKDLNFFQERLRTSESFHIFNESI